MKLSFDKAATRKLELWATRHGIVLTDTETQATRDAIAALVIDLVEDELDDFRNPPQPNYPAGPGKLLEASK